MLKNFIETEITVSWDAEADHQDKAPRNIMVRDDGSVVLIDFNQAVVYPLFGHPHPKYWEGVPPLRPSPIVRYWPFPTSRSRLADSDAQVGLWANWIPRRWLENKEYAAEWLLETWGAAPGGKHEALPRYFLDAPEHVERGPKILRALERLGRKPVAGRK